MNIDIELSPSALSNDIHYRKKISRQEFLIQKRTQTVFVCDADNSGRLLALSRLSRKGPYRSKPFAGAGEIICAFSGL
jgi:hypothetical protein